MSDGLTPIAEVGPLDPDAFDSQIGPQHRPVMMRGIARDWPLVEAGRHSPEPALVYVKGLEPAGLALITRR